MKWPAGRLERCGGCFNICARVVGRRAVADDTSNVGSVDDVHLASKTGLPRFPHGSEGVIDRGQVGVAE